MKQHAQHTRNTLLTVLMAGVAGVGFSTAVTAATAAEVGANPIVNADAQASYYVAMHMSATGSAFHNARGRAGRPGAQTASPNVWARASTGWSNRLRLAPRPPARPLQPPGGGCTEATSSVANRK